LFLIDTLASVFFPRFVGGWESIACDLNWHL